MNEAENIQQVDKPNEPKPVCLFFTYMHVALSLTCCALCAASGYMAAGVMLRHQPAATSIERIPAYQQGVRDGLVMAAQRVLNGTNACIYFDKQRGVYYVR